MLMFNEFDVEFDPTFIFDPEDLKEPFDFLKDKGIIPKKYNGPFQAKELSYGEKNEFANLLLPDIMDFVDDDELDGMTEEVDLDNEFDPIYTAECAIQAIIENVSINKTTSFDKLFGTEELIDKNFNRYFVANGGDTSATDFCVINKIGHNEIEENELADLYGMNPELTNHNIIRLRRIFDNGEIALATDVFILDKKYLQNHEGGYYIPESLDSSGDYMDFSDVVNNGNYPDNDNHDAFSGHLDKLINDTFTEEEQSMLGFFQITSAYDDYFDDRDNEPRKADDESNGLSIGINSNAMKLNDSEYAKLLDKVSSFMYKIAETVGANEIVNEPNAIEITGSFAAFSTGYHDIVSGWS